MSGGESGSELDPNFAFACVAHDADLASVIGDLAKSDLLDRLLPEKPLSLPRAYVRNLKMFQIMERLATDRHLG